MGKATNTLEGLDYSETAYATAKMRLQRKFGGPRRQLQNQIEKLRSMKPLHADNVEDFTLENIVVLLQTQGKLKELQSNSSLYTMSLEKFLRKCCLNITAGLESDVNLKLWKFSKIGFWMRLIIVSKQQKLLRDLNQVRRGLRHILEW